jgi:exonuclease III
MTKSGSTANNKTKTKKSREKLSLKVATFNTRTLKDDWRKGELCQLSKDLALDVIAVQEHRIILTSDNSLDEFDLLNSWNLHLATADANGCGGVGFLLSPKISALAPVIKVHSERIISLRINLKERKCHLINVYSPTAAHTTTTTHPARSVYNQLQGIISGLPKRDITILLGDFNATLSDKNELCLFPCGNPNANSLAFMDLLRAIDFLPMNARFTKRLSRQITFIGPKQRHCRLDYITIGKRWHHLVRNCDSIKPTCIPSDHKLLWASLTIGVTQRLQRKSPRLPYWAALHNKDASKKFESRYKSLKSSPVDFTSFCKNLHAAAVDTLPARTTRQKPVCIWEEDPLVKAARQRLRSIRKAQGIRNDLVMQAETTLQETYDERREHHITEAINELNAHDQNKRHTMVWKCVNSITGRKERSKVKIVADTDSEKARLLKDHFENLLNNPSPNLTLAPLTTLTHPTASIDTSNFTPKELLAAAKSTPGLKAPGRDSIPAIVLRTAAGLDLLEIMNAILNGKRTPPPEWLLADIIPIPKKGNLQLATNYRGISLMATSAKLFNKLLLKRIQPALDPILLPIQNGFRPARGTLEHVLATRLLVDRCKTRQMNAVLVFIDFTKAFDSINRNAIQQILLMYHIPDVLVKAIMAMYTDTQSRVKLNPSTTSEDFETQTGVLQGDTLAPFIFVVVLDYVLRLTFLEDPSSRDDALKLGNEVNSPQIGALAYADDVVLCTPDCAAAQRMVTRLANAARTVGLNINCAKSQVMILPLAPDPTATVKLNDTTLDVVQDFTYLGINIADSDTAFSRRKGMAWDVAKKLEPIFLSNASSTLKVKLFRSTVEQVLLYGCETITITASLGKTIDGAYRHLLRHAIGVIWPQKMPTAELKEITSCPDCTKIIRSRRLRLLGHILRAGNTQAANVILQAPMKEKFRVGGHRRFQYTKMIEGDLTILNATFEDSQNKKTWREICQRALAT